MKLAITGASGFVASEIIPRLRQLGHELYLFSRGDYDHFREDVRGCDAIIHTAVLNNNASASLADFRAVNVYLTQSLAEQARDAGVPLFINLTSLHAIPPFRSHYARTKYEGEQVLSRISGIRTAQLRLAAVHTGTRFSGKLALLNALPASLRPWVFLPLSLLRPTTHIDRLVAHIAHVLYGGGSAVVIDKSRRPKHYRPLPHKASNPLHAIRMGSP